MKHETAGDPITGLKWTRKTTAKIAKELQYLKIQVGRSTVGRLLKGMKYSLRVNHKKIESGGKPVSVEERKDRDKQFRRIQHMRQDFAEAGNPVISVDSKKRELVGNFKNNGTSWRKDPHLVNDHDFRSDAEGIAISYGIYDPEDNKGFVSVGISCDTPKFAATAIEKWWRMDGKPRHPQSKELLILPDCGGSNSARSHLWKYEIKRQLCDRHGLTITVCHYPPGASKWNPIEHRMFSEISKNWAGEPLENYETILNYIRTTRTSRGLEVQAHLDRRRYKRGEKISDAQLSSILLKRHRTLPQWNYTLAPN